jgi:hypothetical protein
VTKAPPRRVPVVVAVLVLVGVALPACSSDDRVVEGIVVAVDGDLVDVRGFELALDDGSRLLLVPGDGVRFHDGLPLSHLQQHLVAGTSVEVRYTELDDGTLVALEVRDAG